MHFQLRQKAPIGIEHRVDKMSSGYFFNLRRKSKWSFCQNGGFRCRVKKCNFLTENRFGQKQKFQLETKIWRRHQKSSSVEVPNSEMPKLSQCTFTTRLRNCSKVAHWTVTISLKVLPSAFWSLSLNEARPFARNLSKPPTIVKYCYHHCLIKKVIKLQFTVQCTLSPPTINF